MTLSINLFNFKKSFFSLVLTVTAKKDPRKIQKNNKSTKYLQWTVILTFKSQPFDFNHHYNVFNRSEIVMMKKHFTSQIISFLAKKSKCTNKPVNAQF